MLANKRKTIGVFICGVTGYFQMNVCRGIMVKGKELGFNIAIFSSFEEYGNNIEFGKGEKNIIDLPDYENLSGVILALDTFNIEGMEEELVQNIRRRCHCPVISIRREVKGFHNILIDDSISMDRLIRHFILEHKLEKICFMTGRKGFLDAEQRLDCFKKIMREFDLPVSEDQIFYGDFWKNKAKEACDHFLKDSNHVPQAILCANDYMAVSVCNELVERGIRVPEDILVSGFDGIKETNSYVPSITTVKVPFYEMGCCSVEMIYRIHTGKIQPENVYFVPKEEYKESCGCDIFSYEKSIKERKDFYVEMDLLRHQNMQSTFMAIDLEEITSLESLAYIIEKYINNNTDYDSFYLCICDEIKLNEDKVSWLKTYTATMNLKIGIQHGVPMRKIDIAFPTEELLPEEVLEDGPMMMFFSPLHYKDHCFGYTAISFHNSKCYGEFYEPWIVNIGNALEDIYIRKKLKRLIREMEELYVKDSLTNLYNRHGFEKYTAIYYNKAEEENKNLFVLGMDLDDMKGINDQHGHVEGDNALKVVAAALTESSNSGEICSRIGGDEFYVFGMDYSQEKADDFIERMNRFLNDYNLDSGKPYQINVSYGVYISDLNEKKSREEYIRLCDQLMYEQKKKKRKRRKK